ncbi:MAG: flagellar basal body rod protein FlgB [Xanthobacteraceae bacterium]
MAISGIPLFSMLRTRMHWHQERQRLLAENVANADTPKFQPRDLAPLKLDPSRPATASVALVRTNAAHLTSFGGIARFDQSRGDIFEARPSGNAVSLEDEMLKVAGNQMDFQAASTLYTRGLGLLRTAIGRRS